MRKFMLFASTFVALGAATALPAGADTISFTLTPPGVLSISGPTGNVSLGSQMSLNQASTISGQLGTVTVSDQRGGSQSWTASVIASAFLPLPTTTAIAASAISYSTGTVTATGTSATSFAAPSLTGASTIVTGLGTGVSTTSWNPTITVAVPANAAAGVYTSTITHSVV